MAVTTQSWECPQCLELYPFTNSLPFLRGTCKHDVCKHCIMMKADATTSRRCNDEKAGMPSSAAVLVQCPIGRCVGGFLYENENDEVGASKMSSSSKKEGNAKVSAQDKVEDTSSPRETESESTETQELQLNSRNKNGTSSSAVTPDSTMSLPFASYDAETETSDDEDCTSNQSQKDCPSATARQRSNRKRRLSIDDDYTSVSGLPPEQGHRRRGNSIKPPTENLNAIYGDDSDEGSDTFRFSSDPCIDGEATKRKDSDRKRGQKQDRKENERRNKQKQKMIEMQSKKDSQQPECIDLCEEEEDVYFINSPIFHVNPFINVKKKKNKGFAPFIHEGVVTAGFDELPSSIACRIDEMSYDQIKTSLKDEDWFAPSDRWQVAMWLKHATIGSHIVLRHEYAQCKFCPQRLKDENGKYIGKVYVIGVITKKVNPGSTEEKSIAKELLKWECPQRFLYNFCIVEWKRMGMKKDLKDETQRYLNSVCVPTIARICNKPGNKQSLIRRDLWEKATMTICPNEFNLSDVRT